MGVENFLNYESFIEYQNKQLAIWGQPVTVYHPTNQTNLGYENVVPSEVESMDSDKVLANEYERYETKGWINFTVQKKVYYKFNWFPEDGDELCMAVFNSDSLIKENDYIRTATNKCTSIWGDMIFRTVHTEDIGIGQVLQRIYFLKPTNNADLHLSLG